MQRPPPSDDNIKVCPNCGQRVTRALSHCPNCGEYLLEPPPGALSNASLAGLGCLALGFGSIGTCSLLPIVLSLFDPRGLTGSSFGFAVPGAIASYIAILCVRRILESIRARRDKP